VRVLSVLSTRILSQNPKGTRHIKEVQYQKGRVQNLGKFDSPMQKAFLALKHPSAAYQRLGYHIDGIKDKRHKARIHEYEEHIQKEKDAMVALTGFTQETVNQAFIDFSKKAEFSNYIDKALDYGYDLITGGISAAGNISLNERRILFVLCRLIKPEIVLETGVANGISSAYILEALEDNNRGNLFSVDLPSVALRTIFDRDVGWIVPEQLRHRWNLTLGKSSKILPIILPTLKKIDFSFHDSNHSYNNMMFEFRSTWPIIRDGGILACDDAVERDTFLDFSDSVGVKPVIFEDTNSGAIRKLNINNRI
jgi:hypothetical protein